MAAFKHDLVRKVNTCKDSYKESLDAASRQRYNVKLALIGGVDPYENNMWSTDVAHLPTIEQEDIYHKISLYTRQQFKASKQLGAHNQLTSDWVKSIMSHNIFQPKTASAFGYFHQLFSFPIYSLRYLMEGNYSILLHFVTAPFNTTGYTHCKMLIVNRIKK